MCEPLRGKKRVVDSVVENPYTGLSKDSEHWQCEEVFREDDVKSAVEFYKKYRYNSHELETKYPEIWNEWDGTSQSYVVWLFDYVFGDVIDD